MKYYTFSCCVLWLIEGLCCFSNKVLDIVIEVFNGGGSQRLDVPEPPSSCPTPSAVTPEMTKAERFRAFRQRLALRRRKAEMYSLWCDTLYRLSLANHVS
jgi:DNA-directed RNA polymerase